MPSDLLGLVILTYSLHQNDLISALGPICNKIQRHIIHRKELSVNNKDIDFNNSCSATWYVSEMTNQHLINLDKNDLSDLFFICLSILDCEKSRIIIADINTEFPDIFIDAMYDLMGAWDLIIKFRTTGNGIIFYEKVIKQLTQRGMMSCVPESSFTKSKLINIYSQAKSIDGLIEKGNIESIRYTLLKNHAYYDKCRANRSFIIMDAQGSINDEKRKVFLHHINDAIKKSIGLSIIESICEGESHIIIETFSTCAQSNYLSHLNKAIDPILTAHYLQKYSLICYFHDETGLLENSLSENKTLSY